MKTCPRCLKTLVPDSVHTCTPTPYARGMEAELERLESAFLSQANELGTAIQVLEDIHPDCAMEYRYRVYPRLHKRPDGFRMPSVGQRGIGDSDISSLLDERDALKSQLDALGARLAGAEATVHGLKLERDRLTNEAKLCRGMVSAQEAMIKNALEPLGCGYPFDHHAAEWAADQIGGLKAENAALKQRIAELEAKHNNNRMAYEEECCISADLAAQLTASRASEAAFSARVEALEMAVEVLEGWKRYVGETNEDYPDHDVIWPAKDQAALAACREALKGGE